MNELTNRRIKETLDKEKHLRRAWEAHGRQQQIFPPSSEEFKQFAGLSHTLEDLCAEPSRTGKTEEKKPPSRRKQLVQVRMPPSPLGRSADRVRCARDAAIRCCALSFKALSAKFIATRSTLRTLDTQLITAQMKSERATLNALNADDAVGATAAQRLPGERRLPGP
uniref:Uncharacterized protein n=1 Tax=Haptolina brevifila TaxID=156173 RepID=A0A6U7HUY8_9EUKA